MTARVHTNTPISSALTPSASDDSTNAATAACSASTGGEEPPTARVRRRRRSCRADRTLAIGIGDRRPRQAIGGLADLIRGAVDAERLPGERLLLLAEVAGEEQRVWRSRRDRCEEAQLGHAEILHLVDHDEVERLLGLSGIVLGDKRARGADRRSSPRWVRRNPRLQARGFLEFSNPGSAAANAPGLSACRT